MNSTQPAEADGFAATLQSLGEQAYQAFGQLSQTLDQTLGAELTTALTVLLGLLSLGLALLPFLSGWRGAKPAVAAQPVIDAVLRDDKGEEVVQLHPERLQQLYDLPASAPAPASAPGSAPASAPAPVTEPAREHDMPVAPPSAPTARNDVLLGLVADLSDELTQQQLAMKHLKQRSDEQQQQIVALLAQVKAQSSAFLLQGERLLQLESQIEPAEQVVSEVAADTLSEDVQRLSTFDQAIEMARHGASAEALMSQCGLSVSEARLVVLVHGQA